MKNVLLGFGLTVLSFTAYSQAIITGRVVNAKTKEPLPFVNVTIKNTTLGTTADVEGKFRLPIPNREADLIFTFVGFETFSLHVSSASASPIIIALTENTTELKEVVVHPGDNPALRIIRRVIQNRKENDPENLPSFSYHSYNKLFMTAGAPADTSGNKIKKKIKFRKPSKLDSIYQRKKKSFKKFVDNNHLFMGESYTERKYVRPNLSKETILGNRMSGIKNPAFSFMGTDFQPFSFYKQFIPLLEVNYVNPISTGTEDRYDFTLTDTIYHGIDSVYIISFAPLEGKSFEGLKGQLYINTNGYAIEHVLAETADDKALIDFIIQQKYEQVDGHWFPVQLNSELRFKEYQIAGQKIRFVQRNYLSEIRIGETIPKKEFGLLNVEFDPKANIRDEDFWKTHRPDSLDAKEKSTYHFYSKKSKWTFILNNNMKVIEGVTVGRFAAGPFYIPLGYLGTINKYEGLRVGLGAETGERISRFFVLSGYGAYGFHDKAIKFGGALQLNVLPKKDGFLKVSYIRDVNEPGGSNFIKVPVGAINNESLRSWLVYRMDSIRKFKAEFGITPARFTQVSFFAQQQQRNPAYTYSFITEHDALGQKTNFIATEIGFQLRFAWKEKFSQVGNSKVVTTIAYPQFNLSISRGLAGVAKGEYDFNRIEAKLDQQWRTRGFGTTTFQLAGGKINGNVPYPYLFNGRGSNFDNSFFNSFVVNNYFQTMGFYEFSGDQYAYLFLNHNFGRLTGTKNAVFRPELELVHNMGIGSLKNKDEHQGVVFKTMDKGFLESGLILRNLIRFKNANLFYFGLGAGAFGRYGYYALPRTTDNFSFKFLLTASF